MNKNNDFSLRQWFAHLSRSVSHRLWLLRHYLQTSEGLRELSFWVWMAGVAGMALHTLLAAYAD